MTINVMAITSTRSQMRLGISDAAALLNATVRPVSCLQGMMMMFSPGELLLRLALNQAALNRALTRYKVPLQHTAL